MAVASSFQVLKTGTKSSLALICQQIPLNLYSKFIHNHTTSHHLHQHHFLPILWQPSYWSPSFSLSTMVPHDTAARRILLKAAWLCLVQTPYCLPFPPRGRARMSHHGTQTFTFYHFFLCSLCSSHTHLLLKHAKHTFLTLELLPLFPLSGMFLPQITTHGSLPHFMQISVHMPPPQRSLSQSLFIKKTNKNTYQKLPSHPPPP